MRLHILGNDRDRTASDTLVDRGADLDDVEFYEENYGVFEVEVTCGAPTAVAGLVVAKKTFDGMDGANVFAKVVVVRGWDCEDDEGGEEDGVSDDGDDGVVRRVADIEVSSLGELRALTICSYAYLTKKS